MNQEKQDDNQYWIGSAKISKTSRKIKYSASKLSSFLHECTRLSLEYYRT